MPTFSSFLQQQYKIQAFHSYHMNGQTFYVEQNNNQSSQPNREIQSLVAYASIALFGRFKATPSKGVGRFFRWETLLKFSG